MVHVNYAGQGYYAYCTKALEESAEKFYLLNIAGYFSCNDAGWMFKDCSSLHTIARAIERNFKYDNKYRTCKAIF